MSNSWLGIGTAGPAPFGGLGRKHPIHRRRDRLRDPDPPFGGSLPPHFALRAMDQALSDPQLGGRSLDKLARQTVDPGPCSWPFPTWGLHSGLRYLTIVRDQTLGGESEQRRHPKRPETALRQDYGSCPSRLCCGAEQCCGPSQRTGSGAASARSPGCREARAVTWPRRRRPLTMREPLVT